MRILAWLVCGIYCTIPTYWLLVHPFVDRWRNSRWKLKALGPLWMVLWVLAWAASSPWYDRALYEHAWTWLLALPFWAISFSMYRAGAESLSWTRIIGRHELEPGQHEHKLIDTGVHGRVRHPLYLGHLCTMLGWTIGSGSIACLGMTVFAVVTGALMIPLEERELRERFGSVYEAYMRRVPMILPRLSRRA